MKIYAMERGFLSQLLDDRREILAIAKSLGTAEEMRVARKDLIESLSAVNITPKTAEETAKSYTVDADGVAHIPIVGELTPVAEKDACGAYTAEALTEYGFIISATAAADADDRVKSIVYDINSPGGYLSGLDEAAHALRLASKPTETHVGGMAASAAYRLAAETDRIVAMSPASRVGSVGVFAEEYDDDGWFEKQGVVHRVYTSTDAPDKRPDTKTEEGQKKIVAQLDDLHTVFVQAVANGRDTTPEYVNQNFGRGSLVIASKALAAGMIDEIQTVTRKNDAGVAAVEPGDARETPAAKAETKEERRMDIQTLEKEHSDVFAEAVNLGVEKEKARQAALDEVAEADPENVLLAEVVKDARVNDKTADQIQAKVAVAIRDWKAEAGENPPEAATSAGLNPLSEEDREAAEMAGMTPDEYRQYSKGVE